MKRFLIIFLLLWQSAAFANDDKILSNPEFVRGLDAFLAGNHELAFAIMKPFAEQGNAYAQANLGWLYEKGQGISQNYKEAIKWYRMAGEQGNVTAQFNLGVMYATGQGASQNYAESVKWYRKAGKQGHVTAQYNLGAAYANGNGVQKNNIHAYMWFKIADSNGAERALEGIIILSEDMSPANMVKAEDLSVRCLKSNYKNCD